MNKTRKHRSSSNKNKIYDFVVIGGGIGGLNVAYQILKRFPHCSLALFEKEKDLGGRVFTYSDQWMNVEAGAGRFNAAHSHFIVLLKELGLYSRASKMNSSAVYAKADGSGRFYNSILDSESLIQDYIQKKDSVGIPKLGSLSPLSIYDSIQSITNAGLDIALGSDDILPVVGILAKVIFAGSLDSKEHLIRMTLLEYASTLLSKEEVSFMKDSFGYYSEINLMNAYDSIRLMRGLDPKNPFFGLKGGLSLVIDELEKRIMKFAGAKIFKGKPVKNLRYVRKNKENKEKVDEEQFVFTYDNKNIFCKKCICALPKQVIEDWSIFKPIRSMLRKIHCAPLCRIYSRFEPYVSPSQKGENGGNEKGVKASVWFKGLTKFTTNNNLRMVIPISEKTGVIMISYTDNIFATFWKKLLSRGGIRAVEDELIRLMKESTGIDIPRPKQTKVFYWDCGAGYWGVGADSSAITEEIIQPFSNGLFICGEHYSATYQQWMEGALETGDRVVQKLML
jgi:hypothetical protein